MTQEEKLKFIYKKVVNKELTFGCKVYVVESTWPLNWIVVDSREDEVDICRENWEATREKNNPNIKVIWRPVYIWDVLGWLDNIFIKLLNEREDWGTLLKGTDAITLRLITVWANKNEPLDKQPDYCIDYVMELVERFWVVNK